MLLSVRQFQSNPIKPSKWTSGTKHQWASMQICPLHNSKKCLFSSAHIFSLIQHHSYLHFTMNSTSVIVITANTKTSSHYPSSIPASSFTESLGGSSGAFPQCHLWKAGRHPGQGASSSQGAQSHSLIWTIWSSHLASHAYLRTMRESQRACRELNITMSFDYCRYELFIMKTVDTLHCCFLDLLWCMYGYCGFAWVMCCVGGHCFIVLNRVLCWTPFKTIWFILRSYDWMNLLSHCSWYFLCLQVLNMKPRPTCVTVCDVTNSAWRPGFLSEGGAMNTWTLSDNVVEL